MRWPTLLVHSVTPTRRCAEPGDNQGSISWAVGGDAGFPKGEALQCVLSKPSEPLLTCFPEGQPPSSAFLSCSGAALALSCVVRFRGQGFVRAQFNLAALSPVCHEVCLDLKKAPG